MHDLVDAETYKRLTLRELEGLVEKYSPDQPRAPAGTPEGGQWTDGEAPAGDEPKPEEEKPQSVREWAERRWGDKVAPNGEKVSENFANWFSGSKAVDEDGMPLELYHATTANFTTFIPGGLDPEESGNAIWMTPTREVQPAGFRIGGHNGEFNEGTNVMPLFANIKTPLYIDDVPTLGWARAAFANGSTAFPLIMRPEWKQNIQGDGYDGIIFLGTKIWTGNELKHDEYIAFDEYQVKSSIGNNGNFNAVTPDVLKFDPNQPRVPKGNPDGGQWTHWGMAGLPGGPDFEAIAKQAVEEVLKEHPRYKRENVETNGLNAAMRDAANHTDWHDWYDRHRDLIEELYGKENAAIFQKFLAAGSINQGVGGNVGESIRAMNHYLAGGSFDKGEFSTLPARRAQYAAIAAGGDPTGRKIDPFYRALAGDPDAVPMDRWMKRIIFKNPIEEGPSDAQTVTGQAVVRAVARHAGMSPRDLQAVLWTAKLAEGEAWSSPTDYRAELIRRRDMIDGFFAKTGMARKAVLDHFPPLDGKPLSITEQADAFHNAAILITAIDLMHKALGTDAPTPEQVMAFVGRVEKYSPDQPRVPAGNSDGGQWTDGSGSGEAYQPTNTIIAYKLFRTKENEPGKLYPLFVNSDKPVEQGKWLDAEAGPPGKTDGRVKSSIGDLAYRPGWHSGDLPVATHIGGKSRSGLRAPDYRPSNQVWAEVSIPADVDWQVVANSRASRNASGGIIHRTAHITDQVPVGGHYRYKTNPNMTGNWIISGGIKVNRILSDAEVKSINDAHGVADLPRLPVTRKADLADLEAHLDGDHFEKYSPDQPRAPAGQPDGGQWVSVDEHGIPIPPGFMTDEELKALANSDDPDKAAKFKAEEEKRTKWKEDTWAQREAGWKIEEAAQMGAREKLKFADTPEPKYLRFGDIPEGEQSTIWAAPNVFASGLVGSKEEGVSAYRVSYNARRNMWEIDDSELSEGGFASAGELFAMQDEFTDSFVSGGHYRDQRGGFSGWVPPIYARERVPGADIRPIHLVTGDEVGMGIDGEPLLRNVKLLDTVSVRDVLHEGYFDPDQDLSPKRNPSAFGIKKFDPNQPRHPKGTPLGGQWRDTNASGGPSVMFEVAPNPDDEELTRRWDSLSDDEKLQISRDIAEEITPKVLEHYGVEGRLVETIGGFEGKVNPSLELQLSAAGSESLIASALGEGLAQKSMVIASASPMEGLKEVAGAAIQVPANERSMAGVKAIFERAATVPGVDGFTYRNNQIEILNFTGVDADTFANQINDSLGNSYRVKQSQIYSNLLESDSYASGESKPGGISGQSFGNSIRSAAQASLDARLRKVGKRLELQAEGWSTEDFLKYSPDQPRAPAGQPDGGRWIDVGYAASHPNPLSENERLIGAKVGGEERWGGLTVRDDAEGWHLSDLRSITRGGGRVAMQRLVDLADEHGKAISLFAVPLDSPAGKKMSPAKLRNWYAGFGFERVGNSDEMVRQPWGTPSWAKASKYSPDQPRVPAGSPDGGQWTDGGSSNVYGEDELLNPEPTPDEEPFDYAKPPKSVEGVPVRVGATPEQSWMAAYRMYGDGKDEIVINPAFVSGGPEQLRSKIAELHRSGWLSTDHPNHVIWHELGHAGLNRTRGYFQTNFAMDVREFHPQFPEFGEVASRVSGMATANGSEFLAEYYAGRRSGRVYDSEVNGLAAKMLRFTEKEQADFFRRQQQVKDGTYR